VRGTLRWWFFLTTSTSPPIRLERITESWLAIGLSRRIGSRAPAGSASHARRLAEVKFYQSRVAGARQPLAQGVRRASPLRLGQHPGRRERRMRRDALEAVDPRDLLDQVLLDLEIEAEARRLHYEPVLFALKGQTELVENRGHLVLRHRNADHLLRSRDAHRHGLALGQARHQVLGRPGLAAADVHDQARGALDAVEVVREVDAALEPVRGIRSEERRVGKEC